MKILREGGGSKNFRLPKGGSEKIVGLVYIPNTRGGGNSQKN